MALPYPEGTAASAADSEQRSLVKINELMSLLTASGGGPHADTHAAAGSDPVTLSTSQITGLDAALAAASVSATTVSAAIGDFTNAQSDAALTALGSNRPCHRELRAWHAKLHHAVSGNAQLLKVGLLGDSWAGANFWTGPVARGLARAVGTSAPGWINLGNVAAGYSTAADRTQITAGPTLTNWADASVITYGLSGLTINSTTNGATAAFTIGAGAVLTGDTIRVWFGKSDNNASEFQFSMDNGSTPAACSAQYPGRNDGTLGSLVGATTIDAYDPYGTQKMIYADFTVPTDGPLQCVITKVGTQVVRIAGVEVIPVSRKAVTVAKWGVSGKKWADWVDATGGILQASGWYAPDVVVYLLGNNDQAGSSPVSVASSVASATTVLAQYPAATEKLILGPPDNFVAAKPVPMADFRAGYKALAESLGYAYVDLQAWAGVAGTDYTTSGTGHALAWYDTLHPINAATQNEGVAASFITRAVLDTLLPGYV